MQSLLPWILTNQNLLKIPFNLFSDYMILSYNVAVIQWIPSCHKTRMTDHTCNNTLARTRNVIDNVSVSNAFLIEIIFILKAIKSHFRGAYDKQNLTLVVISYEIYETSLV